MKELELSNNFLFIHYFFTLLNRYLRDTTHVIWHIANSEEAPKSEDFRAERG